MSGESVENVVQHLCKVSGCGDTNELLSFACTLSAVPGTAGNSKGEVLTALETMRKGQVPTVLVTWYELVKSPR